MKLSRFGPMLLAIMLFAATIILLNYYVDHSSLDHIYWKNQLNPNSVILQTKAFNEPGYLPMFGSSEFNYLSENTHPVHMFNSSNAGFVPFIAAAAGNTDLIQVQNIAALDKPPAGKKAVIVLSMQWFYPGGISNAAFNRWFSPLKAYEMVFNPNLPNKLKYNIAKRLLQFKTVRNDRLLDLTLESTQSPTSAQYALVRLAARSQMAVLSELDYGHAFQELWQWRQQKPPKMYAQGLTAKDWHRYLQQATFNTARTSNKNKFGINNFVFNSRYRHLIAEINKTKAKRARSKIFPVKPKIAGSKNKAPNRTWIVSKEYNDLQLLLNTLKAEKIDPLFIIQAANGYWYDYSGLPRANRLAAYRKTGQMIKAAGFKVADFSSHEYDKGFLVDASHPSAKGWCYMDEAIYKFYHGTME